MPFIHVELVEGRSDEAKAEIAKEIIESVHKHAGAPKEHIHVVFQDMKRNDYYNEQQLKMRNTPCEGYFLCLFIFFFGFLDDGH